jgi:hypothetical protein
MHLLSKGLLIIACTSQLHADMVHIVIIKSLL